MNRETLEHEHQLLFNFYQTVMANTRDFDRCHGCADAVQYFEPKEDLL